MKFTNILPLIFSFPIRILKYSPFLFAVIYFTYFKYIWLLSLNDLCLSRHPTYRSVQLRPTHFLLLHYPDVFIISSNSIDISVPLTVRLPCMYLLNLCMFYTVFIAKTFGSFQSSKKHRKKSVFIFQWQTFKWLNKLKCFITFVPFILIWSTTI